MSVAQTVKVALRAPDRFFMGGEWLKPSTADQFDVIDASTEEVFFLVAEAQTEDMARAGTVCFPTLKPRRSSSTRSQITPTPKRT
jgi:hypothetical protein